MGKIKTRYGLANVREYHFSAAYLMSRKRQKTKAPANWTRRSSLRHMCSPLQRQQEEKMLPPSLRGQGCLRLARRMSRGREKRTLCLFNPFIQPLMAVAWNSKLLPIQPGGLTWGTFTWNKRWFLEASREKWVTERQLKERSKVVPGTEPGSWEVLHKFIHSLEKMLSGCLLCALCPEWNKPKVISWNRGSAGRIGILSDKCTIARSDKQNSTDLEELWEFF